MIKYCFESTRVRSSDWIERLPAEEEVVRSNRTGLTRTAVCTRRVKEGGQDGNALVSKTNALLG